MSKENNWFILQENRWKILEEIAKGNNTAKKIAEKTRLSKAYIGTQLKILEAYGYIKGQTKKANIGKPTTEYKIIKEIAIIGKITPEKVEITTNKITNKTKFFINTITLEEETGYYLQKFYYEKEELIKKCKSISLLGSNEEEIHLLIITDEAEVEEVRNKHSNITIQNHEGKNKKIIIWSHTEKEIEEGLHHKEEYYLEKIKAAKPLWEEKNDLIERYKKKTGANNE